MASARDMSRPSSAKSAFVFRKVNIGDNAPVERASSPGSARRPRRPQSATTRGGLAGGTIPIRATPKRPTSAKSRQRPLHPTEQPEWNMQHMSSTVQRLRMGLALFSQPTPGGGSRGVSGSFRMQSAALSSPRSGGMPHVPRSEQGQAHPMPPRHTNPTFRSGGESVPDGPVIEGHRMGRPIVRKRTGIDVAALSKRKGVSPEAAKKPTTPPRRKRGKKKTKGKSDAPAEEAPSPASTEDATTSPVAAAAAASGAIETPRLDTLVGTGSPRRVYTSLVTASPRGCLFLGPHDAGTPTPQPGRGFLSGTSVPIVQHHPLW